MRFEYKAIQSQQTKSSKKIVLFAAPATEIDRWAGVPQKKLFGGKEETVGFQREEDPRRVSSLGEFCSNEENIIQNPLLCATRVIDKASVEFLPNEGQTGDTQEGRLVISIPDYDALSLEEVFLQVRRYIELRVPECQAMQPEASMITSIKLAASQDGLVIASELELEGDADDAEELVEQQESVDAQAAIFEESHILDFWQEVAARHEVIKMLGAQAPQEQFVGFTRQALLSYLRPVVLVDGQHRLKGSLRAVETYLDRPEVQGEIETRVGIGEKPQEVHLEIANREVRRLPVSLLLADHPAEQVFQFVVVNQKATPIGRALLGTIVSTTLSNGEMETVASRLKGAGIELEGSQAITYLARYPGSPFFNLVERGIASDSKDLLQWSVFASLVSIFRELKGGKLFGYKNDYAEAWKIKYLNQSEIVDRYAELGYATRIDYWRSLDGPWRAVFMSFFSEIRDKFGETKVVDSHNAWGRSRLSNLFNKISLTILAADFFQFLVEMKRPLGSVAEVPELVDSWLEGVNLSYFNRDWKLSGVKKDSTGIRDQWAFQWVEYRKNPVSTPE